MPKLHEILAVEQDAEGTARRLTDEARDTFSKKTDHFLGIVQTLNYFDEDRQRENSTEEKEMVTTVQQKLDFLRPHLVRSLDLAATKEATNQEARADVVVNGETLITDAPAPLLLNLERRLGQLRELYAAIPTLQPGIHWELDPSQGPHVYRSREVERFRTEKVLMHKVLVEPTEHHPAQVEKWNVDRPVATIHQTTWSGMITPAEKAGYLTRLDRLLAAVKKARQRANRQDVNKFEVGGVIFDYLHRHP